MSDLFSVIRERRSVRRYEEKPVEEDKLRKILETGSWAPSAGNIQCVEYIIVKDRETKEKLAGAALGQDQVRKAPVDIVVCCNMNKISSYGERGVDLYSLQESGSVVQNMLLMAHDLGLSTCWVGAFSEEGVSEILGIPGHVRPVAIITLGYPAEKPGSGRRDLKQVVFEERYG